MLAAITREHVRGAQLIETGTHPFRRYFEELQIGESLLTHRRTVGEADIVAFGGLSGDYFYMHFDEIAAKDFGYIPLHQQAIVWATRKNIELVQEADNTFPLRFVTVK
mgnify:CR=1 FL=1